MIKLKKLVCVCWSYTVEDCDEIIDVAPLLRTTNQLTCPPPAVIILGHTGNSESTGVVCRVTPPRQGMFIYVCAIFITFITVGRTTLHRAAK